jgi:hypothetical protein
LHWQIGKRHNPLAAVSLLTAPEGRMYGRNALFVKLGAAAMTH